MSVEFFTVPAIGYDAFVDHCDRNAFDITDVDPPRYTTRHKLLRLKGNADAIFVFEQSNGMVGFEAFGGIKRKVDALFPLIAKQFSVAIRDICGSWHEMAELVNFRGSLGELKSEIDQLIVRYGSSANVVLDGECSFGEGAGLLVTPSINFGEVDAGRNSAPVSEG